MTAALTYGKVVAHYILAVADGPDGDRYPDAAVTAGSITFTPLVGTVALDAATPPTTVIPLPIVCSLDGNGDLIDTDGNVGVYLIATSYRVSVQLDGLVRPISFEVDVPADGVLDLTPNTVL